MKLVSMDHAQLNIFIVNHSLSQTFRTTVLKTWSSWHAGDIFFLFLCNEIIKHNTNIFTHTSFKYFHLLYRTKVIQCRKDDEDLIDLHISITI
jgi:hypothetical protein